MLHVLLGMAFLPSVVFSEGSLGPRWSLLGGVCALEARFWGALGSSQGFKLRPKGTKNTQGPAKTSKMVKSCKKTPPTGPTVPQETLVRCGDVAFASSMSSKRSLAAESHHSPCLLCAEEELVDLKP